MKIEVTEEMRQVLTLYQEHSDKAWLGGLPEDESRMHMRTSHNYALRLTRLVAEQVEKESQR